MFSPGLRPFLPVRSLPLGLPTSLPPPSSGQLQRLRCVFPLQRRNRKPFRLWFLWPLRNPLGDSVPEGPLRRAAAVLPLRPRSRPSLRLVVHSAVVEPNALEVRLADPAALLSLRRRPVLPLRAPIRARTPNEEARLALPWGGLPFGRLGLCRRRCPSGALSEPPSGPYGCCSRDSVCSGQTGPPLWLTDLPSSALQLLRRRGLS